MPLGVIVLTGTPNTGSVVFAVRIRVAPPEFPTYISTRKRDGQGMSDY